jgi:hypothetical protein
VSKVIACRQQIKAGVRGQSGVIVNTAPIYRERHEAKAHVSA